MKDYIGNNEPTPPIIKDWESVDSVDLTFITKEEIESRRSSAIEYIF